MVDIPERTESHGPVFIYGVEGEQIEEENDAYNDLRYDIGEMVRCIVSVRAVNCSVSRNSGNQALHNDLSFTSNNNQQFARRELIKQRKCSRASQGLRGGRDGGDNAIMLPSTHI